MMLITGLTVFLGIALILAKLPRRLMLRALGRPLAIDLAVTLTISAGSRAQLDDIYRDLTGCKEVLIAL